MLPSIFANDDVLNLAARDSANTFGMTGMDVIIVEAVICWMAGGAAAGAGTVAVSPAPVVPFAHAVTLPDQASLCLFFGWVHSLC